MQADVGFWWAVIFQGFYIREVKIRAGKKRLRAVIIRA